MLVDGSGALKMTKDGKVLLSEMQIQVSYAGWVQVLQWLTRVLCTTEPYRRVDCPDSSCSG